jgi:5'(3')-deoxyribonucleotidase
VTTVYVDFDNTIVESNQKVIEILNDKYGLNKSEDDLEDYGYTSIAPITEEEKLGIFESDEFFSNLKFKSDFLKVLNKYDGKVKFIITTKGTAENLKKKEQWVKENIPGNVSFVGITNNSLSKKQVDMTNGIQIDDCTAALDTNADIKILYKDNHNFNWQSNYNNTDILVVNTWLEIDDILSFYSSYDYKTLSKKGE